MTATLSRIDRIEREYDVTVLLPDGTADTVSQVDFAVLPFRQPVDADTAWQTFAVSAGTVVVTFAAPDAADLTNALLAPLGTGDLWVREVDGALTQAARVEIIVVQ